MHDSTLSILEIIKRSKLQFSDLELANFIHDMRKTENAALLPLLKAKTRTVYSFEENDPKYKAFHQLRRQLHYIHNENYISDIVRILHACNYATEFDLKQFHKKSIPAFYDAITKIVTPEILIAVAQKYAQRKSQLAA